MRKSKKVAYLLGTIVFCIGFLISPFVYMPWRATKSHEISLAFPGEAKSIVFSEVSLNDFKELALEKSYYQISSDVDGIYVKAIGFKGDAVYTAEGSFTWLDSYSTIGFLYQNDKVITLEARNMLSYLIGTGIVMLVVLALSAFLASITFGIVRALEIART
ncbi:MAG: hypothetical protein MUP45_01175 [Candidatus Marinimicrobia bacterium]|nr:hypothetical protein [Candidatus Neomarinimicrobiota bacterium]